MNQVYLILGSNLGKRDEVLFHAMRKIHRQIGKIKSQSSIYETAAWGNENQPSFLNCVVLIETEKSPREVLEKILSIENQVGRVRNETKWQERILDIDILFYNQNMVEENDLIIPHPLLHIRRFTLVPLVEIAPSLNHPKLKQTAYSLFEACKDSLETHKVLDAKQVMDFFEFDPYEF
jgi:2-amino-4-hydroxy-6-hydroxymethyldihydropteridine diphosphokinase